MSIKVDVAGGRCEALAAIRAIDQQRPCGVVFADSRMPDLDGIDLISVVKQDAGLQSYPCMVLVSAYRRVEMRYPAFCPAGQCWRRRIANRRNRC